jgi:hypothetical protein
MKNKAIIITIAPCLSFLILLVSCEKRITEWKRTGEEVNGVTVVKNPKVPMYGEVVFNLNGKYIGHFKTPVPAEGLFSLLLFFKNGKAYCVADEDGYKFVKRYNFEIKE